MVIIGWAMTELGDFFRFYMITKSLYMIIKKILFH